MQRLRYFLLAKRKPEVFAWTQPSSSSSDPLRFIPDSRFFLTRRGDEEEETESYAIASLSEFLDDGTDTDVYRVPDELVKKKGLLFGEAPPYPAGLAYSRWS